MKKTVTYQNAPISYRITGEGKTVVLIHGFAEDGDIWNKQVDFLKSHFRLIIPDIPGSGQSPLIPGANIETYAEAIKLILDTELQNLPRQGAAALNTAGNGYSLKSTLVEEDLEKVSIIGHSMGGYIALAFAEKYPLYLNCFGLFHSTAFADSEEKKEARLKAIDFINDKGPDAFLKTTIPGLFTKSFADENPAIITELIEKGKNFSAPALIQYYQAMIDRPDRAAILKNASTPILFIMGEYDNAVPLQSSLEQCYLPIQSQIHLLKKSAHMGMLEEPEKSNLALFTFLNAISI